MQYLSYIGILAALFLAVLTLLTASPKLSRYLTAGAGIIAMVGGLILYGYGYSNITDHEGFLPAVLHALFSVCRMFIGDADFGDIDSVIPYEDLWLRTLVWLLHVLAFYATSSAAISVIGVNLLRNLRVRLNKRKNLNIIYGVTAETVAFGLELVKDTNERLVYVSEDTDAKLTEAVLDSGSVLRTDEIALKGGRQFLKNIGMTKRKRMLTLYCLHPDYEKNMAYATAILEACRRQGIPAKRISLVIHAWEMNVDPELDVVKKLQVAPDRYGYGFVSVYQEAGLAARLMIQEYPPCRTVSFNEEGVAQEDFEALVIGFGQIGQTVLRHLIMNGQFVGSRFRADVFAPDVEETSGYFHNNFPGLPENYDIRFHPHDGRSKAFYEFLNAHKDRIKYIAICTGNEQRNAEIEEELRNYFYRRHKSIFLHQCFYRSIRTTDPETMEIKVHSVYDPDVLDTRKLDRLAMAINSSYQGEDSKGLIADWMECDYFSRMSNRACADFIEAVLTVAGKTEEQALQDQWTFSEKHLENLSRMEHARWNAFHFAMGYTTMGQEELEARAAKHVEEKAATGKGKTRIGKNPKNMTHACLVSWEELPLLDAFEEQVTGEKKKTTYQQMDTNNIRVIPRLLRIRNAGKIVD